jgi:mercuric ion transport protein
VATVELLYFPECPHVSAARAQLRRAFDALGLPAVWTEVDVTARGAPAHTRGYGSPSILVDGREVTGAAPEGAVSCRLYAGSDVPGAPPLEALLAALRLAP